LAQREVEPTVQEQTIYVVANNTYYRYQPKSNTPGDGSWNVSVDEFDSRVWEKWFSMEKLTQEGNNIYSQVYNYLKSRSDFAGVSDA